MVVTMPDAHSMARAQVRDWLQAHKKNNPNNPDNDRTAISYTNFPLLVSDLEMLVNPPLDHLIEDTIYIGGRLQAIEKAINEFQVGYSNRHYTEEGYSQHDYLETIFFENLSAERERLRNLLVGMVWAPSEDPQ